MKTTLKSHELALYVKANMTEESIQEKVEKYLVRRTEAINAGKKNTILKNIVISIDERLTEIGLCKLIGEDHQVPTSLLCDRIIYMLVLDDNEFLLEKQ